MIIDELEYYLKPTYFCDCDNKKITNFVGGITDNCKSDKERLITLFYYIRNHYKYAFGNWQLKASQFISKKSGMCTNKANLLVACLRNIKIPAGFKVIRINARNVFGVFTSLNFLKNKISTNSIHMYVGFYLNKKWVFVDPSLDDLLLNGISKYGYKNQFLNNWDGKSDYVNFIPQKEIIKDVGFFHNIDSYHLKKRITAKFLFNFFSNLYMNYYRIRGYLNI